MTTRAWPRVRLGEAVVPVDRSEAPLSGTVYRQIGVRLWGEGAYERDPIDGSQTKYARLFRAEATDIIVNKIWARNGSVAVVPEALGGCYASGEFPMFTPKRDLLDPRWMHWLTRSPSFWAQCDQMSQGTSGKNRIRPELFLQVAIPLPSLPEQCRIVARIDEYAEAVETAAVRRRDSVNEAEGLFAAELALRMSPAEPTWTRALMKEVIVSMDAGWSPQCDDIKARPGQWGVLKTTSVQWCEFRPHENKALPDGMSPDPALAVQEGDVLVTRAGPRKRVGVVAVVREGDPRLTISDKLIRLRPDRTKILPRFLELALASPLSQEHLVLRKTGLADAQVNISQAILRATPVLYPQLPQQVRMLAELDALQGEVRALKRLQAETAREINALLPGILARAFSGPH